MITPPPPSYPYLHSSAIIYQLSEQDMCLDTSSVVVSSKVPSHGSKGGVRQGIQEVLVPETSTTFIPEFSIARYGATLVPTSVELAPEAEEIRLDENWFFKPKPVRRERIEAIINEVREGHLKNVSLSPLEDSEY